jgi:hypothetical protein
MLGKDSIIHCVTKHDKPLFDEECSQLVGRSMINYSGCRTQVK